jgi:hypothetical protein
MCQQREHLGGRSRGPGEKVSIESASLPPTLRTR